MFLTIKLYLNEKKKSWKGFWFKLLFSSKRLSIGKNFKCDSWPELNITQNGKVIIGDGVYLRRNVELRAHGEATLKLVGDNRIDRGVRFLASNKAEVIIDQGARIGLYSVLNGGDSIHVGKKVLLSGFVYLQTSMHNHKKGESVQDQGYEHAAVVLEDDVWCGAHVVVLPGVRLEKGCVVGSNAVVTKSYPENEVVGGVPAKKLKDRN